MNDQTEAQAGGRTSIVGDILTHLSNLVRKEFDLARAEINQGLSQAGVAIGLIVAAVVIALTALNVLAAALVAGITELGLAAGWSSLIVGSVFAIIAFVLAMKGVNDLKLSNLAPKRTVENVKRDAEAIRESVQ